MLGVVSYAKLPHLKNCMTTEIEFRKQPYIHIAAGRSEKEYWKDIFRYRELLVFLAWRDVLVRYKQTIFGVAWAVFRPLMTMVVFTVIFGRVAKLPSDGADYPILVFAGMLPWQLFSSSLIGCSNSLVANSNLISKVYFPRLIIPISAMVVSCVDFAVSGAILLGLMAWYQVVPTWRLLTLPFFIFLALATATGIGLIVASLNVKFRDFIQLVPFLVQFGLYVSPVGFSTSVIPEQWRFLYSLNPMVGVIEGFRWAIFDQNIELNWPSMMISIGLVSFLCFLGVRLFRKTERTFADII